MMAAACLNAISARFSEGLRGVGGFLGAGWIIAPPLSMVLDEKGGCRTKGFPDYLQL